MADSDEDQVIQEEGGEEKSSGSPSDAFQDGEGATVEAPAETPPKMGEDRLVTLILCGVLVVGLLALIGFYLGTSGGDHRHPPSPAEEAPSAISPVPSLKPPRAKPAIRQEAKPAPKEPDKRPFPAVQTPGGEAPRAAAAEQEASGVTSVPPVKDTESPGVGRPVKKEASAPSPPASEPPEQGGPWEDQPEETAEARKAEEAKASSEKGWGDTTVEDVRQKTALVQPQPEKPAQTPDSAQTPVVIYEVGKANGAFTTAQPITQGVVVGRRATKGDLSDIYRIQATGGRMAVKLSPFSGDDQERFDLTVFDSREKPVGSISPETGPSLTVAVKPEATYYIVLDLRRAPVTPPDYRVEVRFE